MVHLLTVKIPLPYRLRLKDFPIVQYSNIAIDDKPNELSNAKISIKFLESENYNTILLIELALEYKCDSRFIGKFVYTECNKIVNLLIKSYQSVTGSWSNAGLISPIGTSYLQVNSQITADGKKINARAFQLINTFPLKPSEQIKVLEHLVGREPLNLPKIYFTIARELHERGNYSLSYVQTVRAIETTITEFIVNKMQISNFSINEINAYKKLPLGNKLNNWKIPDPRKLDTHLGSKPNWKTIHSYLNKIKNKRNNIIHHSEDASRDESLLAINIGNEFFSIL